MKLVNFLLFIVGLVVVIFVILTARAEDSPRLDNVQSMEPREFCTVIADEFLAGAVNQAAGHARNIKLATAEILENAEHGIMPPKDAMYVPDWDKLTDAEKDFVRDHTFTGYDEAEKIGRAVTDDEAWKMAQAYFNQCMAQRKTEKHSKAFIRVEALENVNPEKRKSQCAEYLSDHAFIGKAVKHGHDCDQMKEWTQTTDGVQDERRTKISRLLDEACAAANVQAWFDTYWKACLEGRKP